MSKHSNHDNGEFEITYKTGPDGKVMALVHHPGKKESPWFTLIIIGVCLVMLAGLGIFVICNPVP